MSEEKPELFYVQDARSYVGNSVVWWCPDSRGYTINLDKAGKYTAKEVATMRDTDVPWPVEAVDKVRSYHVDSQYLDQADRKLAEKAVAAHRAYKRQR